MTAKNSASYYIFKSLNKCPNEKPDRSRDTLHRGPVFSKMSQDFIAYLSNLNSTETQWSIYVNPENLDEYTCVQYDGPNGWVKAGTLDSLSFGFQNTYDAVESFLKYQCDGSFEFNDRTVRFNLKGLLEAYADRNGNEELFEWLEDQAGEIKDEWAKEAASDFVECTLPTIIIEMAQSSFCKGELEEEMTDEAP